MFRAYSTAASAATASSAGRAQPGCPAGERHTSQRRRGRVPPDEGCCCAAGLTGGVRAADTRRPPQVHPTGAGRPPPGTPSMAAEDHHNPGLWGDTDPRRAMRAWRENSPRVFSRKVVKLNRMPDPLQPVLDTVVDFTDRG